MSQTEAQKRRWVPTHFVSIRLYFLSGHNIFYALDKLIHIGYTVRLNERGAATYCVNEIR